MVRQWLQQNDKVLLLAVCIAAVAGIVSIYSATHSCSDPAEQALYLKQMFWFVLGLVAFIMVSLIPHRIYYALSYVLYGAALVLLLGLFVVPGSIAETHRWYNLGVVNFQPSELAKMVTIFAVARFLSTRKVNMGRFQDIFVPLFLVIVPAVLIVREPDLGTALVFLFLVLPMLYWSGLSLGRLFFLVSPAINMICSFNWIVWTCFMLLLFGLLYVIKPRLGMIMAIVAVNLMVGLATPYVWRNALHDYQKKRLIAFMDAEKDPLGTGYQVLQSKIAIGSGGFSGKGFLQGTQTKLDFLPRQHTDFIFAVTGEEFGFLGSVFVLLIFGLIIFRGIRIASDVQNSYASLVAIGIVSVFLFHVVVNIGMTLGIMPVVGLPLSFLSYGGSSLLSCMAMGGLLSNIWMRRKEY